MDHSYCRFATAHSHVSLDSKLHTEEKRRNDFIPTKADSEALQWQYSYERLAVHTKFIFAPVPYDQG